MLKQYVEDSLVTTGGSGNTQNMEIADKGGEIVKKTLTS